MVARTRRCALALLILASAPTSAHAHSFEGVLPLTVSAFAFYLSPLFKLRGIWSAAIMLAYGLCFPLLAWLSVVMGNTFELPLWVVILMAASPALGLWIWIVRRAA